MSSTCIKFKNQDISHDSIEDILNYQLSSEGIKRIESFIFEASLKQNLRQIAPPSKAIFSFGWSVGFNKDETPAYWFRFQESDDDWNEADQALALKISAFSPSDVSIHRITFNNSLNQYFSQSLTKSQWSAPTPVLQMLHSLPLKLPQNSIKNTGEDFFNEDRYEIAKKWMRKKKFENEIKNISIHRRLINCVIVPTLGRQIVDLDAVVLSSENNLCCLEFKRKYPSEKIKVFGIDEYPHIKIINFLSNLSISMRHLILVSPNWNKDTSPLSMLEDIVNHSRWRWLAATLDPSSIGQTKMKTFGTNSGHSGQPRTQYNIKWPSLYVLQEELRLGNTGIKKLLEFVEKGDTSALPPATFKLLNDLRTSIQ